jgi:hypothetical protein
MRQKKSKISRVKIKKTLGLLSGKEEIYKLICNLSLRENFISYTFEYTDAAKKSKSLRYSG